MSDASSVIQTLLETLPCLSLRWIQKGRAHGMNRVQLLVTRGEGVAVQNAQVSVFKGMGESFNRHAIGVRAIVNGHSTSRPRRWRWG